MQEIIIKYDFFELRIRYEFQFKKANFALAKNMNFVRKCGKMIFIKSFSAFSE